jgi:hypothetical protein
MTYFCDRCGLEFVEKKHIKQHLKKKLSCMPIKSEIQALVQLEELNKKDGVKCDICNKIYKNLESLRNHKKRTHCNIEVKKLNLDDNKIQDFEKMNERLDRLEEENKTLKEKLEKGTIKSINNITNNTDNSTKNMTNNITIVLPNSFGKENLDYLLKNPEKEVIKLLRGCCPESIVNIFKEVHKNPSHPENHNIRIENKKEGIISIFENDKWQDHTKMNGLKKIYDNTELKILELIDESDEAVIKKYVKPKQIERFNNETDLLEWADVIDIREDDVKLIDDRIEIIATKEQEIEQKKKEKNLDKKRKDMDSLMMRAVSKKDILQITST